MRPLGPRVKGRGILLLHQKTVEVDDKAVSDESP
jgi:hypothetical protein